MTGNEVIPALFDFFGHVWPFRPNKGKIRQRLGHVLTSTLMTETLNGR